MKSEKPKGKGMAREFELAGADELVKRVTELAGSGARLSAITGLDTGERIEVLYTFELSDRILTLKVPLDRAAPSVESITLIVPGAVLFEREIVEMVGVDVRNHPRKVKTFIAEDYAGSPPLRKPDLKKEAAEAPPWVK
jgi:membrane-bound hydrogenase subunit beta